MKHLLTLIICLCLGYAAHASYTWPRYPTDTEIRQAISDYLKNENRSANRQGYNYKVVKYHSKRLARGATTEAGIHSRALLVIEERYKQFNETFSELHIYDLSYGRLEVRWNEFTNDERFQFSNSASFFPEDSPYYLKRWKSLGELYNGVLSEISRNPDLELGFARIGQTPSPPQDDGTTTPDTPDFDDDFDSDSGSGIPWTVIIGVIVGAALTAAIRKKLKAGKDKTPPKAKTQKPKAKNPKPKAKKQPKPKKKKEKAHYVLALSAKDIRLDLGQEVPFEARVWKITETRKQQVPADIQILNPEPALQISPARGKAPFRCGLLLEKAPTAAVFSITVKAVAEGHTYQEQVKISAATGVHIVFETAPDNKRTLRPDLKQVVTLYAQVRDGAGQPQDKLSRRIAFNAVGDWVDLYAPAWDDGWVGVNVGASNPQPTSISSHPPESVEVRMEVDMGKGKPPLREKLVLQLLDCQLESERYQCVFAATEQSQHITFKVWVEPPTERDWNFSHQYRIGVDSPDEPLTKTHIKKTSPHTATVELEGPILLPPEGQGRITKTLVIAASQDKEKAIESHITVTVSREGLFLEDGFSNQNELPVTATGNKDGMLQFSLYNYDEATQRIVPDAQGLEYLEFRLLDEDTAAKNIQKSLGIQFMLHDVLVNNVARGRYTWEVPRKFPGFGETHELRYQVSAPVPDNSKNPEAYVREIKMLVKSHGIGENYPEWSLAYKNCRQTIIDYIPDSSQRNDMLQKLEEHKYKLDVEGLVKFRKTIWSIAHDLIINEKEGYESIANWCDAIIDTLDWVVWMGDLAFQSLLAAFTGGPAAALLASAFKETFLTGVAIIIEGKSFDDFLKEEMEAIEGIAFSVAKGNVVNTRNIERVYKGSKWKVWALYACANFAVYYKKTGSVPEAAKMTARELRDEAIIRFLSGRMKTIHAQRMAAKGGGGKPPVIPKPKSARVRRVLKGLEKEIKTNSRGERVLSTKRVLEIMEDPAMVRTIKNHGSPELKRAFDAPRQRIYREHDRRLIRELAEELKISPEKLEVDDFRTPGDSGDSLNTDRDYRVLRKVRLQNGKIAKIEVSRKIFEEKSYRIFGELTGKPSHIPAAKWAGDRQQMATDLPADEAGFDYSDQGIDPVTGERIQIKSNINEVKAGKSTLKSPENLGDMYKNKVKNAGERPEKYAQAQKATHTLKKVKKGYRKQGYKVKPDNPNLAEAMEIIEQQPTDVDMTPQRMHDTHKRLQKLGYKNGVQDVVEDIKREFVELRNVPKKGLLERLLGG